MKKNMFSMYPRPSNGITDRLYTDLYMGPGDYTQVSTLVQQIFYSLSNLPLFNDQGNLTPLPYAHQYSLRNTVIDQCVKYCLLS